MKNSLKKFFPIIYLKTASVKRYCVFFSRFPNLIAPKRFSDKLLCARLKWTKRDLFPTLTSDKWGVRDYVKERVGVDYLSKVYLVVDDASLIDFDKLNYPIVLKSTHGSGHVQILKSRHAFDEEFIRNRCNEWLSQKFPLWYGGIKPRIICEEYLKQGDQVEDVGNLVVPLDYKFFVFSGKVRFIVVDVDRFGEHKRSLYLPDWTRIPVGYEYPQGGDLICPVNLGEMLRVAEILSSSRKFVRVDLYDLCNRVVFGEITHSPDASLVRFYPDNFDFEVGGMWM